MNSKHKIATASGLGAAAVTIVNVVFGWTPSIEVLGAECTLAAYICSYLPGE